MINKLAEAMQDAIYTYREYCKEQKQGMSPKEYGELLAKKKRKGKRR